MGEIVNLRRTKKRLMREVAGCEAAAARVRHGTTKAERQAAAGVIEAQGRMLDNAKIERLSEEDKASGGHGERRE